MRVWSHATDMVKLNSSLQLLRSWLSKPHKTSQIYLLLSPSLRTFNGSLVLWMGTWRWSKKRAMRGQVVLCLPVLVGGTSRWCLFALSVAVLSVKNGVAPQCRLSCRGRTCGGGETNLHQILPFRVGRSSNNSVSVQSEANRFCLGVSVAGRSEHTMFNWATKSEEC